MPRKNALPKKNKPPTRAACAAIIRRFLKTDQNINWVREMSIFSRLYEKYPDVSFWQCYELPFGNESLNMMSWFESVEGAEEIERAWIIYHWRPADPIPDSSILDLEKTVDTSDSKDLSYPIPTRRPKTISEFLKS